MGTMVILTVARAVRGVRARCKLEATAHPRDARRHSSIIIHYRPDDAGHEVAHSIRADKHRLPRLQASSADHPSDDHAYARHVEHGVDGALPCTHTVQYKST